MDGDGDFYDATTPIDWDAGFVGVVGHGVEARHERLKLAEESIEGWFGGWEGMEELRDGNIWTCSEVTKYTLTFRRAQEEQDLLLVDIRRVFSQ